MSGEQQVAFVARFGPLLAERRLWGYVSNVRDDGIVREGALLFHSDFAFTRGPVQAISLHALEIPAQRRSNDICGRPAGGGDTAERLRARLTGRRVVNAYDFHAPGDQPMRRDTIRPGSPYFEHPDPRPAPAHRRRGRDGEPDAQRQHRRPACSRERRAAALTFSTCCTTTATSCATTGPSAISCCGTTSPFNTAAPTFRWTSRGRCNGSCSVTTHRASSYLNLEQLLADSARPALVSAVTRPRLTVDGIVDAALMVLDEEGIDQFTTINLARRLGVTQPALYGHVRGLDQLARPRCCPGGAGAQ